VPDQVDLHRLSLRASVLVWICLSVVGWAVIGGIGYSVYRVGSELIANWQAPDRLPSSIDTAGSAKTGMRELQHIIPAARSRSSGDDG